MLKKMIVVIFLLSASLFVYAGDCSERRPQYTKFTHSALGDRLNNDSDNNAPDDAQGAVELLSIPSNNLLEADGNEQPEINDNNQRSGICCVAARCNPCDTFQYLMARAAHAHPCEYMLYGFNRTLIALGLTDANVQDDDGRSALVLEADNSNSALTLYNAAWPEVNDAQWNGRTALIIASENGDAQKIHALIAAGAHLDVVDHYGWTALMSAAFNDDATIVELLLAAKANPDIVTRELGWTTLMHAATRDNIVMIKILKDAGAGINNIDRNGDTALILAARRGHVATVELLLAARANLHIINKNNETALILAANYYHSAVVQMLINEYHRRFLKLCPAMETLILKDSQALIEQLPIECGQAVASLFSKQDILALRLVSTHCLLYAQHEFERLKSDHATKLKENLIEDIKSATPQAWRKNTLLERELAIAESLNVATALGAHAQQPINVKIAPELSEDSGAGVGGKND